MEITLNDDEWACRKQITFDLGEHKLALHFPHPARKVARRYYARAWKDIKRFMEANDFKHRQYSAYNSTKEMKDADVYMLVWVMAKYMPWLWKCLKAIDVTNIGKLYDLMPYLESLEMQKEAPF